MSNTDKVRRKIKNEIKLTLQHYDTTPQIRRVLTDKILAIPNLLVKAESQELPTCDNKADEGTPCKDKPNDCWDCDYGATWETAQQNMLFARFVKVEEKK